MSSKNANLRLAASFQGVANWPLSAPLQRNPPCAGMAPSIPRRVRHTTSGRHGKASQYTLLQPSPKTTSSPAETPLRPAPFEVQLRPCMMTCCLRYEKTRRKALSYVRIAAQQQLLSSSASVASTIFLVNSGTLSPGELNYIGCQPYWHVGKSNSLLQTKKPQMPYLHQQ